jgi:quinol monooxygenase YgiN
MKKVILIAAFIYLPLVATAQEKDQHITVVYSWKAKAGKAEALKTIYKDVLEQMEKNEPGALAVESYFDESTETLVIYDLFKDSNALAFHLSETAAAHFPDLLQIAEPGPFRFCGQVPEYLQKATREMGLQATFAQPQSSFDRRTD